LSLRSEDLPSKARQRESVAPKAPLKKADRLGTGFTSWEEEKSHEERVRKDAGHANSGEGYTVFKKKNNAEEAAERKRKARIEARIRPDDQDYFIPSKVFEGWKFDYIFTTRNNGTGYYWDGMDSIKKESGELKVDPRGLDKLQGVTSSGSTSKAVDDKPKKKKRKKNTGPVMLHDPNNPLEQVQAILLERRNKMIGGMMGFTDLPSGWETSHDPVSHKPYYFNRATGERSWEKPKQLNSAIVDASISMTETKEEAEMLPEGWKSALDSASGKTYYYHENGETSWEKPV
jgi:hypothetical protein